MRSADMDDIYRRMPLEDIPWNSEEPPEALVDLVDAGAVRPCKTLSLGCGCGNYAIYLAGRGFDVTGVDMSPTAIGIAKKNAKRRGAVCHFIAADVLGGLADVGGPFGFAYDWALLHHIFPEHRPGYVQSVHRMLTPKGRYLSLCFSEESQQFGGSGKYRDTSLGTALYFSSEDELRGLFKPCFDVIELKTIVIGDADAPHLAVYAFMEKR